MRLFLFTGTMNITFCIIQSLTITDLDHYCTLEAGPN